MKFNIFPTSSHPGSATGIAYLFKQCMLSLVLSRETFDILNIESYRTDIYITYNN